MSSILSDRSIWHDLLFIHGLDPSTLSVEDADRLMAITIRLRLDDDYAAIAREISALVFAGKFDDTDITADSTDDEQSVASHLQRLERHALGKLMPEAGIADWKISAAAARAVHGIGAAASENEAMISNIAAMLQSNDSNVRRLATEAVMRVGDSVAANSAIISNLVELLRDSDANVRQTAAEAVRMIGSRIDAVAAWIDRGGADPVIFSIGKNGIEDRNKILVRRAGGGSSKTAEPQDRFSIRPSLTSCLSNAEVEFIADRNELVVRHKLARGCRLLVGHIPIKPSRTEPNMAVFRLPPGDHEKIEILDGITWAAIEAHLNG